ncbi:hypothetical protein [Endozoicomonas arenosclerae]|uniref:hypothetical protein n=1 Tax=Endozoicomonas arenosclerae TaxID=1633495 RepID=UPI000784B7EA|nr:hypothetical protein [Endozoicomonas arenosclerae]
MDRKSNTLGWFILSCFLLSALMGTSTLRAESVFRPHVPDFYQHQQSGPERFNPPGSPPLPLSPGYDNGEWHEADGGYCMYTALTNAFYALEKQFGLMLFDFTQLGTRHKNRSWLERAIYLLEDMVIWSTQSPSPMLENYVERASLKSSVSQCCYNSFYTQNSCVMAFQRQSSFRSPERLDFKPAGNKQLKIQALRYIDLLLEEHDYINRQLGLPDDNNRNLYTMYSAIHQVMMETNHVVIIVLKGWGDYWWAGSFHAVTVAGIENDHGQHLIWVSDPDNTMNGSGWGYPLSGNQTLPIGAEHYDPLEVLPEDGRTIMSGPYEGAEIDKIFILTVDESSQEADR